MLGELEALAARLGVAVRAEAFGKGVMQGRGGLCFVDGKPLVVMDERMTVPERIAVLAAALARFDVDDVGIPPVIREAIEAVRKGRKPRAMRSPKRAHPGLARAKPRGR